MGQESKKWLRFRIATLLCLFVVLFIALMTRAFQLQVLSGTALKGIAARQHTSFLSAHPERGIIFDRNGEKLAASILTDSVCADPSKIRDPRKTAQSIASVLGVDPGPLQRRMTASKHFCWLARQISPEQAARVEAVKADGVFLIKEPKRFYPNGTLAGHLIGFVGVDSVGLEGLEMLYDEYLKGTPEKLVWGRDAKGKRLYPRTEKVASDSKASSNLILTIDGRIQHLVETKLREAVKDKGAKAGYAIVMDPKTGEILAMANEPSFDPNQFSRPGAVGNKNKAIVDCYDPGSIFKPFLIAAALEERIVREGDRVFCENGHYAVADRVIHEAQRKRHGSLTVREVLKYSSNIGCVKISERLGKEKFYDYITKFGFGSRTGIDLPGESQGLLRHHKRWTRVDAATAAFGQGVSVSGIQMITALSAIANEGVLMKPMIVKGIVDKEGQLKKAFRPETVRRILSPATARRVAAMMTGVVEDDDGTGRKARIENVNVAGKTGTSQKFDFSRRVYSSDRVRTSFMGFFPAEAPQVVMLVVLDEPQRDRWGGVASAPVFRNIGEQMLTCFKTHIRENAPPAKPEVLPGGEAIQLASASLPLEGATCETDGDLATMPDFRGLAMRDVLSRARRQGIEVRVDGHGWAVHQEPAPGTPLANRRFCRVSFGTGQ